MANLINFVLFQIGWFACVLSAAANRAWIGAAVVLGIAAVYLARSADRERTAALLGFAALFGLLADTALLHLAGVTFASSPPNAEFAPYWMSVLWINFAMTLNHSLAWLQGRMATAAVLGAFFGPLAYYAGAQLGALEAMHPDLAYVGAGVIWGVALPLLLRAASRVSERTANPLRQAE